MPDAEKSLNLGCGHNYLPGFINIDKSKFARCDKRIDLEKGHLPFKDKTIELIVATHLLEHIKNIIPLMNECYRVLKDTGEIHIIVPQNEGTWADPTHCRAFSRLSFRYYCGYPFSEIYGIKTNFTQVSCEFINNRDGGILSVILRKERR